MMAVDQGERSVIEWAWAGRGLEGPSGDLHVVVPFAGGALVALLDGLGHGPEAAAASMAAVPVLQKYATEPVVGLVLKCHGSLNKTRGAVMSLASFDARASSMTWIGVGNVDGVLLRQKGAGGLRNEAIATRAGVVGFQLPPLRADTFPVSPGDTLILTTDGIRNGFSNAIMIWHSPRQIADSILAGFAKGNDDAHVVVARYVGAGS